MSQYFYERVGEVLFEVRADAPLSKLVDFDYFEARNASAPANWEIRIVHPYVSRSARWPNTFISSARRMLCAREANNLASLNLSVADSITTYMGTSFDLALQGMAPPGVRRRITRGFVLNTHPQHPLHYYTPTSYKPECFLAAPEWQRASVVFSHAGQDRIVVETWAPLGFTPISVARIAYPFVTDWETCPDKYASAAQRVVVRHWDRLRQVGITLSDADFELLRTSEEGVEVLIPGRPNAQARLELASDPALGTYFRWMSGPADADRLRREHQERAGAVAFMAKNAAGCEPLPAASTDEAAPPLAGAPDADFFPFHTLTSALAQAWRAQQKPRQWQGAFAVRELYAVLAQVVEEIQKAYENHANFNSPHEAYAVILEELDEYWDHVKANTAKSVRAREELVQIAAVALRALMDTRATPST